MRSLCAVLLAAACIGASCHAGTTKDLYAAVLMEYVAPRAASENPPTIHLSIVGSVPDIYPEQLDLPFPYQRDGVTTLRDGVLYDSVSGRRCTKVTVCIRSFSPSSAVITVELYSGTKAALGRVIRYVEKDGKWVPESVISEIMA